MPRVYPRPRSPSPPPPANHEHLNYWFEQAVEPLEDARQHPLYNRLFSGILTQPSYGAIPAIPLGLARTLCCRILDEFEVGLVAEMVSGVGGAGQRLRAAVISAVDAMRQLVVAAGASHEEATDLVFQCAGINLARLLPQNTN